MAKTSELILELDNHYQMWTKDNEKRMSRTNGWNDITDAYYGKLPLDWPYITKIVDPRIRTSLIEKNARIINNKLRGRLVPREGGDVTKAMINNAILDYQWDTANDGGSMLTKMSICDMDARLYQSKFVWVYWKYEEDSEGNVLFDGNEMMPLDIRDCGIDPAATHIKDAKWFHHRQWVFVEDLENQSDGGKRFKNIDKIKRELAAKAGSKSSTRRTEYTPRVKQLRGLEDRLGEDIAFPMVKICTEYRRDRWITFAPDYKLILRDIKNPYDHGRIPIAQLRYYPLQDDPLGESEVEAVIPLWKAIQATVCGYMDEVILKMRPPLKIIENAARIETIVYGPEEQWLVDRQDAIQEMVSSGQSLGYFQTTYQALVAAFNIAMGDLSQGLSNFGPFETEDKTATEIKATTRQQLTRDQKNQNDLGEFIKDIMSMWMANNKQFLFTDPDRHEFVLKIVGSDKYEKFRRSGLSNLYVPEEAVQMIGDVIEQDPSVTPQEIDAMYDAAMIPEHPVVLNPKEEDPTKLKIKEKMKINGNEAELSVTPKDLEGTYDYIPDVKSMSAGAYEEMAQARQRAIEVVSGNQTVLQLLQLDGWRPNMYELLKSDFENIGLTDAERFFTKVEPQTNPATAAMGGVAPNTQVGGLPNLPQATPTGGIPGQVAGPSLG